jgi:hypothetical protein
MVRFLRNEKITITKMKGAIVRIIISAFFVLFITGCKKNFVISDKQAVLFQLEYVNYAWGYQHNGYIIDSDGNVLTFNNPENWNFPGNDLTLSEIQIAENVGKCIQTGRKIPPEELHKYTNYINNIASSKVTALKNVAADAGSTEYICYQYSQSTGTYKGNLIKMEGDFTCENLNFYSKKVAAWMRDINNSIINN